MFVVKTQILENYGAHSEDGKFSSGNAYWKFKGGNDYIVNDVTRPQDAMAFVAAKFSENNISFKEFPTKVITWQEWQDELMEVDEDYREFLCEQAIPCSPIKQTEAV
jgi:hypothetical protein